MQRQVDRCGLVHGYGYILVDNGAKTFFSDGDAVYAGVQRDEGVVAGGVGGRVNCDSVRLVEQRYLRAWNDRASLICDGTVDCSSTSLAIARDAGKKGTEEECTEGDG